MLFMLEMYGAPANILLVVFPSSLGTLAALLMPGFLVWGAARACGACKEPSQRRAMVLVGAVIAVVLMVIGMSSQ